MKRKNTSALSGAGWAALALAALILATGCRHTEPFRGPNGEILPGSIAAMETAEIGGMEQSLWFRGQSTENTALILIHGGPGASEGVLFRQLTPELEEHFLVVYWEQRGAGRSYHGGIPPETMTVDQFVRDLDEVVDLVRERFTKERVVLLGHSWGSVPGTLYAHRHPEKVAAYVSVAPVADFPLGLRMAYVWTLEQAWKQGDRKAVRALNAMAPAPETLDEDLERGEWTEKLGGVNHGDLTTGDLVRAAWTSDEANFMDLVKFSQGLRFSMEALYPVFSKMNLKEWTVFETPIVFMLGRHDWHVPAVDAADHFKKIDAPAKRLIWFERSGHNPPFEEPDAFVRAMVDEVLPLAPMDP